MTARLHPGQHVHVALEARGPKLAIVPAVISGPVRELSAGGRGYRLVAVEVAGLTMDVAVERVLVDGRPVVPDRTMDVDPAECSGDGK